MIKNRFSISTKDEFEESKLETEIAFSEPKKKQWLLPSLLPFVWEKQDVWDLEKA